MAGIFHDDRFNLPENSLYIKNDLHILKSEVPHAVKLSKINKAVGTDGIPIELLKMIGKGNVQLIRYILPDVSLNLSLLVCPRNKK